MEIVRGIEPTTFPFSQRPAVKRKARPKTDFADWLSATTPVNSNSEIAAPILSLEDELMLAKLRELARPFSAEVSYAKAAALSDESESTEQYMFEFMASENAAVDEQV